MLRSIEKRKPELIGYSNANYVSDLTPEKSTSGA